VTNHAHLLATAQTSESISRLLQYVGRHYVPYVNHSYGRSGTLWEARFKASIVDASEYLLACYRFTATLCPRVHQDVDGGRSR